MKNENMSMQEAWALIGALDYLDRCSLNYTNIREQRVTDPARYRVILREMQEQIVIALNVLEER